MQNRILDHVDFSYYVAEANCLVNKRPIAFKESLHDSINNEAIDAITPEILVRGYDVPSVNIIPQLQSVPDDWVLDENSTKIIQNSYQKLQKCRDRLRELYHSEFLAGLVHQATNQKERYKPKLHRALKMGDIVLLKDPHLKPTTYPLAIVKKVKTNSLGEVTAATVFKGKTRQSVYRYVSSLILLIPNDNEVDNNDHEEFDNANNKFNDNISNSEASSSTRPTRKAAEASRNLLNDLIADNAV